MEPKRQYSERIVNNACIKILNNEELTKSERINCLYFLVEQYRLSGLKNKRYWTRNLLFNIDKVEDPKIIDKVIENAFIHQVNWNTFFNNTEDLKEN